MDAETRRQYQIIAVGYGLPPLTSWQLAMLERAETKPEEYHKRLVVLDGLRREGEMEGRRYSVEEFERLYLERIRDGVRMRFYPAHAAGVAVSCRHGCGAATVRVSWGGE